MQKMRLRPGRITLGELTTLFQTETEGEYVHCTTFLARDAFVRTNRNALAVMFIRQSVHLSVWDGRAL